MNVFTVFTDQTIGMYLLQTKNDIFLSFIVSLGKINYMMIGKS